MSQYLLYFALAAALVGFGIGVYLWLEVERLQRALEDVEAERDELRALRDADEVTRRTPTRRATPAPRTGNR